MKSQFELLLVDDDDNDVELFLLAMGQLGFNEQVAVACDGVEALELLDTQLATGRLPKVLVIDLQMTRMDGLQLLQRLKQSDAYRLLPKVMLTSSRVERDIRQAYDLGANAYLVKSVDFKSFQKDLKSLTDFWLVRNLTLSHG